MYSSSDVHISEVLTLCPGLHVLWPEYLAMLTSSTAGCGRQGCKSVVFFFQSAAKDNRRKRKEFVRQLEEEVRRSNARNFALQHKLDALAQENK